MATRDPRARRRLALTQGDPGGVGPELLLRLAAEGHLEPEDRVFADPAVLARRAAEVDAPWSGPGLSALEPLLAAPAAAGVGVAELLAHAVDAVLAADDVALVTGPIHKADLLEQGFEFPGHTEYLAHRAGVEDFAMAMLGPVLRLTLVTIHVPLAEVPPRLDEAGVVRAGRLLAQALSRHLGVARPRIAVLGLNPHAGEGGHLGSEDARVIAPAVARLAEQHGGAAEFIGPVPADAAFPLHAEGRYDGVVAMYHDQGLAPFKLLHARSGVNVTLGLPFVRTSPDHGTARDLAGTGRADPGSMIAAVRIARGLAPWPAEGRTP